MSASRMELAVAGDRSAGLSGVRGVKLRACLPTHVYSDFAFGHNYLNRWGDESGRAITGRPRWKDRGWMFGAP